MFLPGLIKRLYFHKLDFSLSPSPWLIKDTKPKTGRKYKHPTSPMSFQTSQPAVIACLHVYNMKNKANLL